MPRVLLKIVRQSSCSGETENYWFLIRVEACFITALMYFNEILLPYCMIKVVLFIACILNLYCFKSHSYTVMGYDVLRL